PTTTRKTASARYARSPQVKVARTIRPAILCVCRGRDQSATDDGVAFVEDGGLTAGDPVGGLVELEPEPGGGRLDARDSGGRPVAELCLGALYRNVQPPARAHARGRECRARADDDRVRARLAAQDVERRPGRDADSLPLPRSEAPVAVVPAEGATRLVRDRAGAEGRAVPFEERAVVVAREEAGLLALGTASRHE